VKQRLNVTNFGSKNKRLEEIIKRFKLPSFHLKKVDDLLPCDFKNAFNDPDVTSLVKLCVALGIAKKMHNATLKARIVTDQLKVPQRLHKSIFGVSSSPWTYPRRCFVKQNQLIPTTCSECSFVASFPQQIQIHHLVSEASSKQEDRNRSLKKNLDYNKTEEITTICANCHSLKHHKRGIFEKKTCGLWLTKKTTNRAYENPMDIFVKNCPDNYTLQKKYLIRTILKTPEEYLCNKCGISVWIGQQLVLQLHHKDSDPRNAELTNLLLLCPNCHTACHGITYDSSFLTAPSPPSPFLLPSGLSLPLLPLASEARPPEQKGDSSSIFPSPRGFLSCGRKGFFFLSPLPEGSYGRGKERGESHRGKGKE